MPAKNFLVVRDSAPEGALRGAVVAIGNFDGMHRGHRAVIGVAQDLARALGRPAAALTFEPHPRAFFNPGEPLFRLTDEAAKLRLLASTGLDGAIVLTFDAALAGLSAESFVERILVERFAVSGAVIGFNFHFGTNRAGSPDFFESPGREIWLRRRRGAALRGPGAPGVVRPDPRRARRRPARPGGGVSRLSVVRVRPGDPRRQARPRARLSHRQPRARRGLRAAPRHLCG